MIGNCAPHPSPFITRIFGLVFIICIAGEAQFVLRVVTTQTAQKREKDPEASDAHLEKHKFQEV